MKPTQRLYEAHPRSIHGRIVVARIAWLSCQLSAAVIALLLSDVPVAAADQVLYRARVAAGRVWYDKYCTPCHGPGGGPGSAVYRVGNTPVDLRRYVARHQGQFPDHEWIAVIEHVDLTSPHAGVWEQIRTAQTGTSAQGAAAGGVVALIADYINTVQMK